MNKTSFMTAKTFLKMAEYDRRILLLTGIVNKVVSVILVIKLMLCFCAVLKGRKK